MTDGVTDAVVMMLTVVAAIVIGADVDAYRLCWYLSWLLWMEVRDSRCDAVVADTCSFAADAVAA